MNKCQVIKICDVLYFLWFLFGSIQELRIIKDGLKTSDNLIGFMPIKDDETKEHNLFRVVNVWGKR